MSREVVAEVYKFSRSKGSARQVLRELAEHANGNGEAWPSVARLAERTNLSARQVQRGLTRLLELRELEIVKAGGGKRRPTRYRVVPRNGATQLELALDGPVNGDDVVGVSPSANGDIPGADTPTNSVRNGDDVVTQTVRNLDSEERPPVRPPTRGPDEAAAFFAQVKDALRGDLPEWDFARYVEPCEATALERGRLRVRPPDGVEQWVRDRYAHRIARVATRLAGRNLDVDVIQSERERLHEIETRGNARRRFRRAERQLAGGETQPEPTAP